MKKIISLFQRNYDGDRLVRNEVVPGAEWVVAGEGVATRKYLEKHVLISHGMDFLCDVPTDFDGLKAYLGARNIEGIVWHAENGDGRMVKIKRKDFFKEKKQP
jgi:hypothetical protein